MTYRDIIYDCLDLAKLITDDIIINEEHVMFLVDKYRAALLWQKYKSLKLEVPESNYQTLCLSLETLLESNCGPTYKHSVEIPKLMEIGNTVVSTNDYYSGVNICLVSRERMRYVGTNPILDNIIYCSINPDGKLYLKSNNPQFTYLELVKITGVFENPMEASELECSESCTDPMDRIFPLEESLVTLLQASVLKDIVGAAWRPSDNTNDSNDDLASLARFIQLNTKNKLQKQLDPSEE